MDYKSSTTRYVVIKFDEKIVWGKDCIDLIPIKWTYIKNGQLKCRYPDKKEYSTIDVMSKTLTDYGAFWKGFGISIVS